MSWASVAALWLIGAPTASAQFPAELAWLQRAHVEVQLNEVQPLSSSRDPEIVAVNNSIPNNPQLAVAAPTFSLTSLGADAFTRVSALDCLTAAIYYEAANENIIGQRAVAQVVLNRVRHPAFPNTVCDVVFQGSNRPTGCQFTFTCDGSLSRRPVTAKWLRAQSIAASALAGSVEPNVGHSTHYHASYVFPYWAPKLTKVATIGSHIFYQWQGSWSKPSAFVDRYAFREDMPAKARAALAGFILARSSSEQIIQQINPQSMSLIAHGAQAESTLPTSSIVGVGQARVPLGASADLKIKRSELIEPKARLKDEPRGMLLD